MTAYFQKLFLFFLPTRRLYAAEMSPSMAGTRPVLFSLFVESIFIALHCLFPLFVRVKVTLPQRRFCIVAYALFAASVFRSFRILFIF